MKQAAPAYILTGVRIQSLKSHQQTARDVCSNLVKCLFDNKAIQFFLGWQVLFFNNFCNNSHDLKYPLRTSTNCQNLERTNQLLDPNLIMHLSARRVVLNADKRSICISCLQTFVYYTQTTVTSKYVLSELPLRCPFQANRMQNFIYRCRPGNTRHTLRRIPLVTKRSGARSNAKGNLHTSGKLNPPLCHQTWARKLQQLSILVFSRKEMKVGNRILHSSN